MRSALLLLGVLTAATGCGANTGSSETDCINKFATKAGSSLGAQATFSYCRELHTTERDAARKRFLNCAIPAASGANSDFGARVAIDQCHKAN